MQIIKEEVFPLDRRQNIVLLIIIACIFQFFLFFAPALAADAMDATDSAAPAANQGQPADINTLSTSTATAAPDTAVLAISAASTPSVAATSTLTVPTSTPAVKVLRTSTHVITAYNSDVAQTDDDPCTTANGFNVCQHQTEDTIAANFLKFGTKVQIPELFGDRVFVVRDRMNKKHANRVDVWMNERADAINFGVKVAQIRVIE
jgi:3D (Asp-Asp-Asp) domain-containing protein